jgi:hypothetical protein
MFNYYQNEGKIKYGRSTKGTKTTDSDDSGINPYPGGHHQQGIEAWCSARRKSLGRTDANQPVSHPGSLTLP